MDPTTLLLLLVVAVVAASQMLRFSGKWILAPWLFWPVEALLVALLVYVLAAPFDDIFPQARAPMRGFLSLFVVWRLVQNWMLRSRVRQRIEEEARLQRTWQRRKGDVRD